MKYTVDLNCDLGESFGAYRMDYDEEILKTISSANIACGFHTGNQIGLLTAKEVFSDRTYQRDGSLTNRIEPNALITDHKLALKQIIRMVKEQKVTTTDGIDIDIQAHTICIHGDGETALEFSRQIPSALKKEGIEIQKVSTLLK